MTEKDNRQAMPELSDQDADLLSAYIDGMLGAEEQTQLEARLSQDTFLRSELAAMRQTVRWLNELPALQAPRNFTITPEMVAEPTTQGKPANVIPLYRRGWFPIASAAAAVFVVVIGLALVLPQANQQLGSAEPNAVAAAPTSATLSTATSEADQQAETPQIAGLSVQATAEQPALEVDNANSAIALTATASTEMDGVAEVASVDAIDESLPDADGQGAALNQAAASDEDPMTVTSVARSGVFAEPTQVEARADDPSVMTATQVALGSSDISAESEMPQAPETAGAAARSDIAPLVVSATPLPTVVASATALPQASSFSETAEEPRELEEQDASETEALDIADDDLAGDVAESTLPIETQALAAPALSPTDIPLVLETLREVGLVIARWIVSFLLGWLL